MTQPIPDVPPAPLPVWDDVVLNAQLAERLHALLLGAARLLIRHEFFESAKLLCTAAEELRELGQIEADLGGRN